MPAKYLPKAYTPGGRVWYLCVARHFFGPLYAVKHRLEVSGRENLPIGPFIAVGNHLSNVDPPMLAVATDSPLAFLAKEELYSVPVISQLILSLGAISVRRSKPEPSTFKAVKKVFAGGWNLGMFIEGTRCKTPGTLGQPHDGPAYFARANKVPLVPVGLIGTHVRFGKAYARIGKPINYSDDLQETTWKVMAALSELTGYALPEREKMLPAAADSKEIQED